MVGCLIVMAALAAGDAMAAAPKKPTAPAKAVKAPAIPAHVVPTEPGLLPDMSLGNPKAPVTVIEYASAACPHCAHWNKDIWPAFQAKYVATGKVRYVFREIVTSPAEYALSAFLIGRCAVAKSKTPANSGPYFAVLETFFTGQEAYFKTGDLSPLTQSVQKKTGLNPMAQLDCVTDEKQLDAFYKTMNTHAEQHKIRSTPSFVVNGKLIEGHEMADLDAAIAAAAKK
nr:thioredoxin domain-containing protein [Asticcacaulis solisilvae]